MTFSAHIRFHPQLLYYAHLPSPNYKKCPSPPPQEADGGGWASVKMVTKVLWASKIQASDIPSTPDPIPWVPHTLPPPPPLSTTTFSLLFLYLPPHYSNSSSSSSSLAIDPLALALLLFIIPSICLCLLVRVHVLLIHILRPLLCQFVCLFRKISLTTLRFIINTITSHIVS